MTLTLFYGGLAAAHPALEVWTEAVTESGSASRRDRVLGTKDPIREFVTHRRAIAREVRHDFTADEVDDMKRAGPSRGHDGPTPSEDHPWDAKGRTSVTWSQARAHIPNRQTATNLRLRFGRHEVDSSDELVVLKAIAGVTEVPAVRHVRYPLHDHLARKGSGQVGERRRTGQRRSL